MDVDLEGAFGDDDVWDEEGMLGGGYGARPGRRPAAGERGEVNFSVYVDPAPAEGEVVMLKGNVPELTEGIQMQPCETGNRKLWTATVAQLTIDRVLVGAAGPAMGSRGLLSNVMGGLGGLSGGLRGGNAPMLFEVTYSVVDAGGRAIRTDEKATPETAPMRTNYYHRASFCDAESVDETFPLFVHDEVHLLQSGQKNGREFLNRFVNLSSAPFARKRALLEKALEELIVQHWGPDAPAPPQTVLAVAATLGHFRRQQGNTARGSGHFPLGYDAEEMVMGMGSSSAAAAEKEEPPPSLIVCRWIVQHCPARQDLNENDDAGDRAHARDRHGRDGITNYRQDLVEKLGVLQAAETLYVVEKTFEWLKLLNFLPEHHLPNATSASQCSKEEGDKLVASFASEMNRLFADFRAKQEEVQRQTFTDAKEREKREEQVRQHIEQFLSGLCRYGPSVEGLQQLVARVVADHGSLLDVIINMVFQRFRSLQFGSQDKAALKSMLRDFPFMHTDECATALLGNSHHPSDSFQATEIVGFIKELTESRGGVRPAGAQLQNATRRWLMRLYSRPPERPERRPEERQAVTGMTRVEYDTSKAEIREAIRSAIRGWRMVLELRCFNSEEETLRMILFELSQAYFFKDPDPLMVLACMLELEEEIRATGQNNVRQLESELQRIAVKSVRDAQDTSEEMNSEELLRLLFESPTPLRFHVIEQFISFRQAAFDLGKILKNEPIWTHLLSKTWVEARGLRDDKYPLASTQKSGQSMLLQSSKQLVDGRIHLNILHTILQHQGVYEKLVTQVTGEKPTKIPQSGEKLHLFDKELQQMGVYVRMYCSRVNIDVFELSSLIEDIKLNYSKLELNQAASKFQGLLVREHLPWLFSLRGSNVFQDIWHEVTTKGDAVGSELKQEYVVHTVIPKAKKQWEQLSKSIETGSAVLKDIEWCVNLEWKDVFKELELLESTAPKTERWVPHAVELTKAMRLAAKLREWAPSMLHLRQVLGELFTDLREVDPTEQLMRNVVDQSKNMWGMKLGTMVTHVTPFRETINMLTEPMQDYVIAAAKHDPSLQWLVEKKVTEDFNRLISLSQPNTDDPVILAALASLKQTRTFLAEVLYTKPPYKNLWAFLQELATLHVDETVHQSLLSVQQSYDPMINLLTQQARAPGVQACYDLKKIYEEGTWQVVCSTIESSQICIKVAGSEFGYEALAELRRQLLMTDVPEEVDGARNLGEMLEEFVYKFKLLEEYGRCTMELFQLGHFAYQADQQVLSVEPKMTAAAVEDMLRALQQKLASWQKAVEDARGKHYFLNYFTVRELCYLVKTLPQMDSRDEGVVEAVWQSVWPLLRVVDLTAAAIDVKKQVISKGVGMLQQSGNVEVNTLNALGELLTMLFDKSKPQVRHLPGLHKGLAAGSSQHLQGDLLMRSLQSQEEGKPIFVCFADDPSKVTEMVLSIYARRERVPEAEELLLCSSNTQLEEVELLLCRFFHARAHQREDRLYCLGNVHLLPYVVQCGTVEALRKLEDKFGYGSASALVFVSGLQNQMLTNALSSHNLAMRALPEDFLRMAVSKVGELYHGRQLEAVASAMNGVGKTHHILRQVHEIQKEHGNRPVLHHVEIRETTDISGLVTALLADPTDPALPTAVHIDLAHILPSHVDTLLFELLIVGMLRDTQHSTVYHRRKQDFFLVEIPNSPAENTAKQMSFCLILPRTYLRMNAERMDSEMPVLANQGSAMVVEFVKNKELEVVGKTLDAMSLQRFNPKSKDFTVSWTAAKTPPIDLRTTYNHLMNVCCSEVAPPAFLVFMNFIKFLGTLVFSAEQWNMMNLQLLQNFDPGLKHFKHCFYKLLIETSRDFALRQVPKQMIVHDARGSPLAPAPVRTPVGTPAAQTPTLRRQNTRGTTAQETEAGGVGRVSVADYAPRFDKMASWEQCVHPIASFKKNDNEMIIGCNIMSLQREFLANFIDRNLQNSLNLNDLRLERDWSKVTYDEAVQLVHQIEGGDLLKKGAQNLVPQSADYVVTIDNLLKLMSIQQRLKYGLPVILMGETGCGKTALVRFLAKCLNFRLMTLDIHGGITDQNIIEFMSKAISETSTGEHRGVLVFFDEINAANCMALFKTIIIDRVFGNTVIPNNVRIISCCNPYRTRKANELEQVALVYQHQTVNETTAKVDPMKNLVYRVHPLPESLIDVVSDFGSLTEKSELLYVNSILRKELLRMQDEGSVPDPHDDGDHEAFLIGFRDLLCKSQSYVREVNNGERSTVSMRDIARAARVFKWFLTYYFKLRGVENIAASADRDGGMRINVSEDMKPHLRNAVILTLGYCYHSRLDRNQRWGYRKRICDAWRTMKNDNPRIAWLTLDSEHQLTQMLIQTQHEFVSQMELGEGIALNEALRENLFMLLVSIMNQIPILLIGKPGCSKSLAMGVLQNNLNGEVSSREFFKTMPSVEVFAYQCSPLSTPEAILGAFHSARQSNLHHKSTIVCVLLDEVGLAEESPHLPLKVLHRELENLQGIACVGISNWALDAAKMSRCVTLYRPPPTVEDLSITAEGMVASANLKGYLKPLSEAFFETYKMQKICPDFWGMREFYSTVRVINMELRKRADKGLEAVLEPQVLMKTVQRNFGGQSVDQLDQCVDEFFERCGMDENASGVQRYTTAELIQQNLEEPDARHLMLLTKNNAALRLLFESNLLNHSKAKVMFGSTFSNDQSDIFVAMNLQKIKGYMQQPISLVLVHCDSLYESLYDLLNQHYMEYAGQRYVRIAHGSKAKQCPIHRLFRVIVVTEMYDAYYRLAAPLLNRFEKQIFLRKDLMTHRDEALLARLVRYWASLQEVLNGNGQDIADEPASSSAAAAQQAPEAEEDGDREERTFHRPVAGYHPEMLSSLVFTLRRRFGNVPNDELFAQAKEMLTWVMTPEAACIVASRCDAHQRTMKFGFDLVAEYFQRQQHSDLPSFVEDLVKDKKNWCDDLGAQVMVTTFSPIRGSIKADLDKAVEGASLTEVSLHEFSSSQDIEKTVHSFYANATTGGKRFLVIHADPAAASLRVIEHARFVCETERAEVCSNLTAAGAAGSMFVLLVVHLQRGTDSKFSFDFDSQWHFAFLDSVEPSSDLNSMPLLGDMLNLPLIRVVRGLDFEKLLQTCFRASLSRLIYPHSRKPEDLQRQIQLILQYLADAEFVRMVRDWILLILETTPRNPANEEEGTAGDDTNWFAAIATAAHELSLAGTFRNALHNRVVVLVGSLLTVLLAHLDRNQGLALLEDSSKRKLWLSLYSASLTSNLSAQLKHQAVQAINEDVTAQHEVGTDAQTQAKPFVSRFPASWFASKSVDGERHVMESLPPEKQLSALEEQYKISRLHEVGLNHMLSESLLDDYLHDFTAMHVDWTVRIDRNAQQRILSKTLKRSLTASGQEPLTSILQVHQLFWRQEKQVDYFIKLLNSVPDAVPRAEQLIDTASLKDLNLDLLLLVHETVSSELLTVDESHFTLEWVQQRATQDRDLRHLSTEELQTMGRSLFYREWLQRKMVVANLAKDYLESAQARQVSAKLTELKTDKEPRLESLALLVQQVASTLKLPLSVVRRFLQDLPAGKIRNTRSFRAILKLAEHVAGYRDGLTAVSAFCESWVLDVCLRDAEAISDLDETALRLVCSLAAGAPLEIEEKSLAGVRAGDVSSGTDTQESGIATLADGRGVIPRSSCLNLALLRKLLFTSEKEAKQRAVDKIHELLVEVSRGEGNKRPGDAAVAADLLIDTTFATRYTVLMEEEFDAEMKDLKKKRPSLSPADWPDISLESIFTQTDFLKGQSFALMLKNIGKIRWMLTEYSKVLSHEVVDEVLHDECVKKVNNLLQCNEGLETQCRSLRLYLLKSIQRPKGVSFLRGLLDSKPLKNTDWVTKWRGLHDVEFEKFVGAALVPKWNPFSASDETREYKKAKAAIFEMMTSTATDKLDAFARECTRQDQAQRKRDIGGLLLALCQEPGLLSALEIPGKHPAWRPRLNEWLRTTEELPVSQAERTLLRIFAGDNSVFDSLPEPEREYLKTFFKGEKRMDDLLKWRFLGHLASSCISAPNTSLLSALREIMLDPKNLTRNGPIFLPSMDEDIRNRVMKALLERGENIWKFKSHWYKCSCGYTFFIGECGRPMETAACPACGKLIGGRDHSATDNTQADDDTDRSPSGYMLPTMDKDEKHISFREIPASSTRLVRLLLHGSMFCGIAARAVESTEAEGLPPVYDHIVNKESMCSMGKGADNEAKYIGDHFQNDCKLMVEMMNSNFEDLSMSLHSLLGRLRNMNDENADFPKKRSHSSATGTAAMAGAMDSMPSGSGSRAEDVNWERLNLQSRNSWEETIEGKYLVMLIRNYDTSKQELHKKWGSAEEDGKFVAELMETADVQGFPKHLRNQCMPQLWAFRDAVTLDSLHQRIGMQPDAKETLPVLCTVLQQQVSSVIRALGYLVGIFDWHSYVMTAFSGRITRSQAQEFKVRDMLEGLPASEKDKWNRAFRCLQKAWDIAWPLVERYECQEIPEHLKSVRLTLDSPMVYCIADPQNEGICSLALTQFLVERHNELVQVVSAADGYPGKKVNSRLLAHHDIIHYSQEEMMRFLKSRCVTYGSGGKLKFDFKQLEQQLRRELARPELTMELRGFNWLGETFAMGSKLNEVLNQKDIPLDVAERIRAEVSSQSVASQMIQKVQMSTSFILKSGGERLASDAGNMLLSDYLRSVLYDDPDKCLPSNAARAEVQLSQLDSFAKLLKSIMNKDPMDSVDVKYKVDLPKELEEKLAEAKPKLPAVLTQVLAQFAEQRLVENYLSDTMPIMEMLKHVKEDFESEESFEAVRAFLPEALLVKHWCATFRLLKQR